MRVNMTYLVFCGLLVLQPFDAIAASVTNFVSKDGRAIIVLTGEIVSGDTDRAESLIKAQNEAGRLVSGIRFNSIGGNLSEGVKLAELVHTAKIATVVPNGSTCASACFIAFAAGSEKYASYQARVGVHGASDQNGKETTNSNAATVAMAKIVKELGVPPAIIGRMVVTPPDQIVWLSPDELRSMGATLTGKPSQLGAVGNNPGMPVTGEPLQLQSAIPRQTQTAPSDWTQVVNEATARSSSQNGGKANYARVCQPEIKICTTAILFQSGQGKSMLIRAAENIEGRVVTREICEFNDFGDVRTCVDWDTKSVHKDMKDAKGQWIKVAD